MTIKEAAKISNSLGFIEKFPMKFQERLGEQATRVSGGQLQRFLGSSFLSQCSYFNIG